MSSITCFVFVSNLLPAGGSISVIFIVTFPVPYTSFIYIFPSASVNSVLVNPCIPFSWSTSILIFAFSNVTDG